MAYTYAVKPYASLIHVRAECQNKQTAAGVLGYSQTSWDNMSGDETQPTSADKYWAELTPDEQAAAGVLGYEAKSWDNDSGSDSQPTSAYEYWAELPTCGENPTIPNVIQSMTV